jgi:cation transport regulator ChaB
MVRRVTPSQYASMMRQAQNRRRQAVNKLNSAINTYNREEKRRVDNYNREVRAHNARVRANRQRLTAALSRLEREARKPARVTYTVKSSTVYSSYERLERRAAQGYYDDSFNETLDLAEREAANSVELESALQSEPDDLDQEPELTSDPAIAERLALIQADLPDRWRGALYSLSPRNPDAARHFCTSAREIFTRIFEVGAPDSAVKTALPNCELTKQGSPTRRAKISFMLERQGLSDSELENFIEEDAENILSLFHVFNDGTHGSAGRYGASQLKLIKQRVENELHFLMRFAIG